MNAAAAQDQQQHYLGIGYFGCHLLTDKKAACPSSAAQRSLNNGNDNARATATAADDATRVLAIWGDFHGLTLVHSRRRAFTSDGGQAGSRGGGAEDLPNTQVSEEGGEDAGSATIAARVHRRSRGVAKAPQHRPQPRSEQRDRFTVKCIAKHEFHRQIICILEHPSPDCPSIFLCSAAGHVICVPDPFSKQDPIPYSYNASAHTAEANNITINHDGLMMTTSNNGEVIVWPKAISDCNLGSFAIVALARHTGILAMLPIGSSVLITGDFKGKINLWVKEREVSDIVFDADLWHLSSASATLTLKPLSCTLDPPLLNSEKDDPQQLCVKPFVHHKKYSSCTKWSARNGKGIVVTCLESLGSLSFASANNRGEMKGWKLVEGYSNSLRAQNIWSLKTAHLGSTIDIVKRVGKLILTTGKDGNIKVWVS